MELFLGGLGQPFSIAELSLDHQSTFQESNGFLVLTTVIAVSLELHLEVADFLLYFEGGSTQLTSGWPGVKVAPAAAGRRGRFVPARRG